MKPIRSAGGHVSRTNAIAFGVLLLLLLIISALAYATLDRAAAAQRSVAHTYQVLSAIDGLLNTMIDAETGTRGFTNTGLTRFLAPFSAAETALQPRMDRLDTLTADNRVQQAHVSSLRTQTSDVMRLLSEIIRRRSSGADIPLELRDTQRSRMEDVRTTLSEMQVEEERLMQQRGGAAAHAEARTRALLLFLVVLATGAIVGSYALIHRGALRLSTANDLLTERVRERTAELERTLAAEQAAHQQSQAAEARAHEAGLAKDAFLAMLGHELRNPLAPIVTALKLMDMKGGEAFQRERRIIARQTEQLVRLVSDLMDVSRFMRGKLDITREPTDLVAVVRQAIESVGDLMEQRRHEVRVRTPEHLIVIGDRTRLAQMVVNLLTNAAKYTPPGGRIEVELLVSGERAEIHVRDNGVGMTPDFLKTAFEPFTQTRQSSARSDGGLGLGLAIVRTLVQAHGGTVSAASGGEGRGSEFVICLPLTARLPADVQPATVPSLVHEPKRVLVVDDNVDAADSLAAALSACGHVTQVAYDARSALAAADRFAPDVALLDLGLPEIDGFELAGQLRRNPRCRSARIIAVTGYGQDSDRERTRAAGFDGHFAKPVALDVLLPAIAGTGAQDLSGS